MSEPSSYSGRSASLRVQIAAAIVVVGVLGVYHDVVAGLARDWLNDGNYSHGLLLVPVAGFIVWQRRQQFADAPARPSIWGFALAAASLALLIAGTLGAELFTARV